MAAPNSSLTDLDRSTRRPLRIFASDPMALQVDGNRAQVDVVNEPLRPGPFGRRIRVIDYDGDGDRFYEPVDLEARSVLLQGGMQPSEADPRFHQQMVYAVAMRTLEHFDRALGRIVPLSPGRHSHLRLLPHAFRGANAYYDADLHAILFGYFDASQTRPGRNLPGQTIFTCLSHDIIAHEMTHAIVHCLRPHFMVPTNADVLAFHEGLADIVALLQHFEHTGTVRELIQANGYELGRHELLMGLAAQFGHATGADTALRSAIGRPEMTLATASDEPHDRGAILVAAVFDAFLAVYRARVQRTLRVAGRETTGPTEMLPYELAHAFAEETWRVARELLHMCIRAFDYLPPSDVDFGDYLRAVVTADLELSHADATGLRGALIEGFRHRRIHPRNVLSMAEASLRWTIGARRPRPASVATGATPGGEAGQNGAGGAATKYRDPKREPLHLNLPPELLWKEYSRAFREIAVEQASVDEAHAQAPPLSDARVMKTLVHSLRGFAEEHRAELGLVDDVPIEVRGVNPVFRISAMRELLVELVFQLVQKHPGSDAAVDAGGSEQDIGGMPLHGGTTVIARGVDGEVRYVIAKPLRSFYPGGEAHTRMRAYLESSDLADPMTPYYDGEDWARRMVLRASLRHLHAGRSLS